MYHSLIIGGKNTWDDWHLVPASRPTISTPELKEKYLDIPGANGALDLCESLTGYPVFKNREGSFDFYVMNDYGDWAKRYSEIMNFLHGRKLTLAFEDDPGWHFTGRFAVNAWKSQKDYSRIVIDYTVEPYKYEDVSTETDSFFNFNLTSSATSSSPLVKTYHIGENTTSQGGYGYAPITPIIKVTGSTGATGKIAFTNNYLGIDITTEKAVTLQVGEMIIPEVVMYGGDVSFRMWAPTSTLGISIQFSRGSL